MLISTLLRARRARSRGHNRQNLSILCYKCPKTATNCWPDISSKREAQSSGQNTNAYENCDFHLI
jgi:hypothetical protein